MSFFAKSNSSSLSASAGINTSGRFQPSSFRLQPFSPILHPSSFILFLCFFLLAPNLAMAKQSELLTKSGEATTGQPAPWFSGWTLEDKVFNLKKAFKDPATKRVALVFWATYCKPCMVGMAKLKKNKAKLHKAGVRVLLLNFKEDKDAVSRFILKHSQCFPVMLDPYGRTEKSYLVSGNAKLCLPRTVIVGRNGKVLRIIGEEGKDYVEQILR